MCFEIIVDKTNSSGNCSSEPNPFRKKADLHLSCFDETNTCVEEIMGSKIGHIRMDWHEVRLSVMQPGLKQPRALLCPFAPVMQQA